MDICPSDALPRKFGTHTQHFDVKWNPNEKRIALVPVGRRSRSVATPPRRRLPWHPCRVPCGPRGSRCLPFPGRARCVRGRAESPRRRRRRDLPRRQGRHGQRHAGGEGRGGADENALDGQPGNAYPPPPPRSTGGSRPPPSTSPAEATARLLGGPRQQQPRSRPAVAATRRPLLPSRGRERGGERMASAPADHPAEPPPPTTARVRTGFPTRRPTRKIARYIPGFVSPKSRDDGGETPSQTAVKRPQHTGFPGIYMDAGFSTGLQWSHRNPGSLGL